MKKILMVNYYLVIMGWCLLLNGLDFVGVGMVVIGIAILFANRKNINYWRLLATTMLSYSLVSFFLFRSSIPYYFPKLSYFLFVVCLDNALLNERLINFKNEILCYIAGSILVFFLLSTFLIRLLPGEMYSMFTKDNLLLIIGFIFLPYLFSPLINIVNRLVVGSHTSYVVHAGKLKRE
ncbi:MAG: hypothetical protein Q4E33_03720 [Erysipelotrichaceae bacterium]|nr:hypothetical protein [Erysipelotrichaceae bacterium]